jgi:hypothetical protein
MSKTYAIRLGISMTNGCYFILLQRLVSCVRKTKFHVDRSAMTLIARCVAVKELYSTWAWRQDSAAVMVSQTTAKTTWDRNNLHGYAPWTFVARTISLTKNWHQIPSRCASRLKGFLNLGGVWPTMRRSISSWIWNAWTLEASVMLTYALRVTLRSLL